jgi:hypothetical protein
MLEELFKKIVDHTCILNPAREIVNNKVETERLRRGLEYLSCVFSKGSAAYNRNQRRRCEKYEYEFTRAQLAAFPSPLSGALNLFWADLGFPERRPRLNSYAPSGAKSQIQISF